ncbi:stress response protein nst1 [Drosophila subobscura]|uniref:stress response protein nst1 n=1 Tax=Drosophila subobscura TaxID=7241 RepID=UPI00155A7EE5|nr:stress response protein nst1 [Drosophila subobscura]
MYRLLLATTATRFQRGKSASGKLLLLNATRYLSKGPAPKAGKPSTAPKCKPVPVPPPKPGYFPSGGMHAVFSDLPMPEGDFMQAWAAKNSKYNMFMLSGLLALIGSLYLSYMTLEMYASVPDYPYTEEEQEEFEIEAERLQEEKEAREQRHQDAVEAAETARRARLAREAMVRESALMNKDMDGGLDAKEAAELQKLATEREAYAEWEKEEVKRLAEKAKERKEAEKEKAKAKAERDKEREKKRKEREKVLKKEEAEREKEREKARKEREKSRKEEEKQKAKEKAEKEKAKKALMA